MGVEPARGRTVADLGRNMPGANDRWWMTHGRTRDCGEPTIRRAVGIDDVDPRPFRSKPAPQGPEVPQALFLDWQCRHGNSRSRRGRRDRRLGRRNEPYVVATCQHPRRFAEYPYFLAAPPCRGLGMNNRQGTHGLNNKFRLIAGEPALEDEQGPQA